MSTDYLATEPGTLPGHTDATPAPAASTFTQTTQGPTIRTLALEFTGSGSEYFRIWIVNLLLIIVTLGLYFPWAKVRRLRYFYGNTVVDGEPLDFHGNPFKMFKGFLIVAAFMLVYTLAGKISQGAGFVAFLVIAGLWPALLKSSMQFRMANTSWRGLRFGFSGSTADAYRACLPLFIPGLMILGLMLLAPELLNQDPAQPPSGKWLGIFGLIMLFALVISPWLMWNLKRYQHKHYRFSSETTQFNVQAKSYYGLSFKTIGIAVLVYIAMAVAVGVGIFGGTAFVKASGSPMGPMAMVLAGLLGVFVSILAFSAIKPYAVARFQNLIWNGTRSEHFHFTSTLQVRAMIALTIKNWLLIVLTLGLYWPFAAIAMTRMRLHAVQIASTVQPDELLAGAAGAEGQTIGDASGDFLGFDIGL